MRTFALPLSFLLALPALSAPTRHSLSLRSGVDPSLVIDFGANPNPNPDGTGNCDGAVKDASGNFVKVPCGCPPDRNLFINDLSQNVAAGHCINNTVVTLSFPTSGSISDQLARLNAMSDTLQNLNGPGKGCPIASTNWIAVGNQLRAEQSGAAPPPPSPAPVPPASSSAPPPAASSVTAAPPPTGGGGVDPSLVLDFGANPNPNPDGTGNCDGTVKDASGNFIKIPCGCPPDRNLFIADLSANVAAGHCINNTVVTLSFPTGGSIADQLTRLNAMTDTLQNLRGPGVGCPVVSTNWSAVGNQLRQLQSSGQTAVALPPPVTSPATSSVASSASAAPTACPKKPTSSSASSSSTSSTSSTSSSTSSSAASAPTSVAVVTGGVDPSLVIDFGANPNPNPDGHGNCDGVVKDAGGNFIKIPCGCPPNRDLFIADLSANVAAGHCINNTAVHLSFPTSNSIADQLTRLNALSDTLQNLRGPGVGCPIVSTNWTAVGNQLRALQSSGQTAVVAPPASSAPAKAASSSASTKAVSSSASSKAASSSAPPKASSSAPAKTASSAPAKVTTSAAPAATSAPAKAPTTGVDPSLVLDFGANPNPNPDGTGNCDGAVKDASGNFVKVPCGCPPDRNLFIADLSANVAAGHAVNNTVVTLSFPTSSSKADQLARLNAMSDTLQNLNGPGKGCPIASTNWIAVGKQLQALPN